MSRKSRRVRIRESQEQMDEKLAPSVQRQPVTRERVVDGVVLVEIVREPLVERDGWKDETGTYVQGMRRVDVLEHLLRRGSVTKDHWNAAEMYRTDWEVGLHSGMPARNYLRIPGGGGQSLPPMNKLKALARLRAARGALGPLTLILEDVAINNMTMKHWAEVNGTNQTQALGRLVAVLDLLISVYRHYDCKPKY